MTTDTNAKLYKVEYTDLFGKVYYSPTTMTWDAAAWRVKDLRTRNIYPMFDTAERCALKRVRVVDA